MRIVSVNIRCKCGDLRQINFKGGEKAKCYLCGRETDWSKLFLEWGKKKRKKIEED
jgi:hypothetical protein